ncbi:MAG: hypothetical protein K1X79_14135 [Oligoflexia bacterium]|nr:hypothetical protein [Oligoflexia bacterium]
MPASSLQPSLPALSLPTEVEAEIGKLAATSNILLIGELHGTREIPQLVIGLLPALEDLGYRTLALEVPRSQELEILEWASGQRSEAPPFFSGYIKDGRANVEVQLLIREAARRGWSMCAFDIDVPSATEKRDLSMARNLSNAIRRIPPPQRVLAICGDLHARIAEPPPECSDWYPWPSLASHLRDMHPATGVRSIVVSFHSGEFYNMGNKKVLGAPIDRAYISREANSGHDLVLHIPSCSVASVLRPR